MKITAEITPPAQATHQDGTPGPWWCVVTVRCGAHELATRTVKSPALWALRRLVRLDADAMLDELWKSLEEARREVWRAT